MATHHRKPLVAAIAIALCGCSSDAPSTSHVADSAPVEVVPDNRMLDASYTDELIQLSFARLDQPFRSMWAKLLVWSDDAWTYYGTLHTANANTEGTLTTERQDRVEILDGVNTAPVPDRYRAPGLPSGRYLVCATLVLSDHREVCGEFSND